MVWVFTVPVVPTLYQHEGKAGVVNASKFSVKSVSSKQRVVKDTLAQLLVSPTPQMARTYT